MSTNALKLVLKLDDSFVRFMKLLSWKYNALKWKHRESKWDYKEMKHFLTCQYKLLKWKYRALTSDYNYKELKVFLAMKHAERLERAERLEEDEQYAADTLQSTAVLGVVLVFALLGLLFNVLL